MSGRRGAVPWMWTGNPVIATKPSLPWLLDGHLVETLSTLRKVPGSIRL